MRPSERLLVRRLLRLALPADEAERLSRMEVPDLGFGFDAFGCERESALAAYMALRLLYRHWFRVESRGHEHIPKGGRAVLVSNHSGLLPFDGMMLAVDCAHRLERPRLVRSIVDHSVFALPYAGVLFQRIGQVPGTKRNFEELLAREQLVLVFPEGARGPCKPYRERYRLRPFHVGFIEVALASGAPVIPAAVVGAEEQAPVLFGSEKLGRRLGVPFIPVTPTFPLLGPLGLVPYPVRYSIEYGPPIQLEDLSGYARARRSDPAAVSRLAAEVQEVVQALVDEGLRRRGKEPRSDARRRAPAEPAGGPGAISASLPPRGDGGEDPAPPPAKRGSRPLEDAKVGAAAGPGERRRRR